MSILEILKQIDAPATDSFAARLISSADDLKLDVRGVGPISFPVGRATAEALRKIARPAPFGLGEETLYDADVRQTWQIAKSRVRIQKRNWSKALAADLRTLQEKLGIPARMSLVPVFDKMLLYEQGQFFKMHQDSERTDAMVGTLVVILPSAYKGGDFVIRQGETQKTFRRLKAQDHSLALLAFYGDCQHELKPVKEGYRIALTFHLEIRAPKDWLPGPTPPKTVDALVKGLDEHFAAEATHQYDDWALSATDAVNAKNTRRLVVLLDHQYSERSLGWGQLKGSDRLRVDALRAAAEKRGDKVALALANVHENWLCEDPYYSRRSRYGRRGYHRERLFEHADRLPEDIALMDLNDSTVTLTQWRDGAGKAIKPVGADARHDELRMVRPHEELVPFEEDYEGYQGNYGNTLDRWYHRAAFILWPPAHVFALKAQDSAKWTAKALLQLPYARPEERADLDAHVRAVLGCWLHQKDRPATDALKLLARLDDADLAAAWLRPLTMTDVVKNKTRRTLFVKAAAHFGLDWAQEVLTAARKGWNVDESWRRSLKALVVELYAGDGQGASVARWLVDDELTISRERWVTELARETTWLGWADAETARKALVLALEAALAIDNSKSAQRILAGLVKSDLSFMHKATLVRDALQSQSEPLLGFIRGSRFYRQVLQETREQLRHTERKPGDSRLRVSSRCSCTDCGHLNAFLASNTTTKDWPLKQDRRQHIHTVINQRKLPLQVTTLKTGRPYVLHLKKKMRELLSQEAAHRKRLQALLEM